METEKTKDKVLNSPAAMVADNWIWPPELSTTVVGLGSARLEDSGGSKADLTMPQNCTEHKPRAFTKLEPSEINLQTEPSI